MSLVTFQNLPNETTPINAANLNNNYDELNEELNTIKLKGNTIKGYKNTTQSITASTQTKIKYEDIINSYVSLFQVNDGTDFVVKSNKIKSVEIFVKTQLTVAASFYLYLYKNEVNISPTQIVSSATGQISGVIDDLEVDDVISIRFYSTTSGLVLSGSSWNQLTISVLDTY